MGWLANAALREAKLLKQLLKLASYSTDGSGNITGFVDASGNPVVPLNKTLTEFLALTAGQVADGAVVHITNVHGPSGAGGVYATWDAVAAKWGQNFGTPWCFTTVAVAAASFPAASFPGWRIRSTTYNLDYYSDGTEYVLNNGLALVSRSNTPVNTLICPAATFTSATPSSAAAGADTLLTSAGAHGLTTAIAITAGASYIYISGGTGWTVGFHKITAIAVNTTGVTIQIDTPYSAGFGTPTIVLANSGTLVPMLALTVPPLNGNGEIVLDLSPYVTPSNNAKNLKIKLNSTEFYAPTLANGTGMSATVGTQFVIYNQNSVSSQKGAVGSSSYSGLVVSSLDGSTGAVDTSVETTLNVYYSPVTANERCGISRYRLSIRS